jgi:hypothetical protein
MRHIDHHSILTDCQHGFRSRRSWESQLISTIQGIAEKLKSVMRASFQSDGTVPEFSDVWKTRAMAGAKSEAHNFNSLVGI